MRTRFFVLGALSVGVLLLAPAAALAQEGTVTVKGTATEQVPNDSASLGFSVSKERRTRAAALRAVAVSLRRVIAAVQGLPGVSTGDIATGAISVRAALRGKRTVYRAGEGISVILHQADRAGEAITAAVAAGATETRGPSFFASDPGAVKTAALVAAFDQAKEEALALASQAGATLGAVISIQENAEVSFVYAALTERKRAPKASEPAPPVEPGTATVKAGVTVVFALQ